MYLAMLPMCCSLQWGQIAKCTHLFSLQCQLYEDLLQLLIDVVDTELLEAVPREDLESIDIQNANVDICQTHCHSIVDSLKCHMLFVFSRFYTYNSDIIVRKRGSQ